MAVIAMTREMGSRGQHVASGLAAALGLEVVHQEVVEHRLADRLQVQDSLVHRYLEGSSKVFDRWRIDRKALALYTAEEIFALAEKGDVLIRGWGATQLLRAVSHVVCVRVCAPLPTRASTLMARLGTDDARVAEKEIRANDAAHSRAIRRLSQTDWRDAEVYDIVLNTERVPVRKCVDLVLELVAQPVFAETAESRAKLASLRREAQMRQLLQTDAPERIAGLPSGFAGAQAAGALARRRESPPATREDRDLLL